MLCTLVNNPEYRVDSRRTRTTSPWTSRQCSPNLQNSVRVTSLSLLASLWPRQLADWRPIKTSRHCKAEGQSELGDCFSLLPDIVLVDSFLLIIYRYYYFYRVAGWLMRRAAGCGSGNPEAEFLDIIGKSEEFFSLLFTVTFTNRFWSLLPPEQKWFETGL